MSRFFDLDVTRLHSCSDLSGRPRELAIGKRNGRAVALLDSSLTTFMPEQDSRVEALNAQKLFRQLCYGLNITELRTWRKLLWEGKSISEVATEERVSRAAIYARIRGSSKGHGGMIAKNDFVALWWLRRSLEEDEKAN